MEAENNTVFINNVMRDLPFYFISRSRQRYAGRAICRILLWRRIESRSEVIADIERALPYLDDPEMKELSNRTIGKLRNMTDEEFEQLELIETE